MQLLKEFREGHVKSQEQGPGETTWMNKETQKIVTIAMAGAICLVILLCLLASAFIADGGDASAGACEMSVESETTTTLVAFAMGWMFCYVAKRYDHVVRQMGKILGSAKGLL